jgi:hypothetical protein
VIEEEIRNQKSEIRSQKSEIRREEKRRERGSEEEKTVETVKKKNIRIVAPSLK